jgi:PAS domain S-box-containing protein
MKNEVNFHLLLDKFHESLIILNDRLEIVFYNKKAKELEMLTERPLGLGIPLTAIAKPERKSIVGNVLRMASETLDTQVITAEYRDDKGRLYFIESTYDPIISEVNTLEYICVMFRDKSHERSVEKRSVAFRKDFSNLIETANAVIFSVDPVGYITDWNTECVRITGFQKEDTLAKKVHSIIEPAYWDKFTRFLERILEGAAESNLEILLRTKFEEPVVALLNATPKFNENKQVVGVLFVGHDITELSQYRKTLEQKVEVRTQELKAALQKEQELVNLKNRFISMASHEFRIPLSTISTAADMIATDVGTPLSQNKLDVIRQQIQHLRSLIDDVITLDKTDATKIKANTSEVDLVSFLRLLAEEVASNYQHSHTVNFTASVTSLIVMSDENLLRNVFINLFSNAIKFSPEKKFVEVSIEVDDQWVVIKVQDFGIGIPAADREKIFTAFNRASNTGTIKGTGLGLSIVRRAVEALNGTIDLESDEQKGTCFKIKLPNKI